MGSFGVRGVKRCKKDIHKRELSWPVALVFLPRRDVLLRLQLGSQFVHVRASGQELDDDGFRAHQHRRVRS